MTHGSLDGDDVATGSDKPRCVEVPKVVQVGVQPCGPPGTLPSPCPRRCAAGSPFEARYKVVSSTADPVKSVPMTSSEKRFEVIHEQKTRAEVTRILRDRETGVCYLQTRSGPSGGLTVLVEPDGSPVVRHT